MGRTTQTENAKSLNEKYVQHPVVPFPMQSKCQANFSHVHKMQRHFGSASRMVFCRKAKSLELFILPELRRLMCRLHNTQACWKMHSWVPPTCSMNLLNILMSLFCKEFVCSSLQMGDEGLSLLPRWDGSQEYLLVANPRGVPEENRTVPYCCRSVWSMGVVECKGQDLLDFPAEKKPFYCDLNNWTFADITVFPLSGFQYSGIALQGLKSWCRILSSLEFGDQTQESTALWA